MKPLPISVCMISGAEAHRIGRALESVSGWVAEIIVVLNHDVADGTEEIAARHGAKVFREPWKGHIDQKNSAAAKASQPWLLGLDADEAVSPALKEEIARVFADESRLGRAVAFSFPRLTWYCGRWIRHGDWYPDRKTRLWRRGQAKWGGLNPHDKLIVDGAEERLAADLYHFTNDSIAHHVRKIIPYTEDFVRQSARERKGASFTDLVVRPFWKFLRGYVFRLGFLDGWQGYYIAWANAFSVVTKYARLREPAATDAAAQSQKPGAGGMGTAA